MDSPDLWEREPLFDKGRRVDINDPCTLNEDVGFAGGSETGCFWTVVARCVETHYRVLCAIYSLGIHRLYRPSVRSF
jgi:hypothetical protein